ncbi:MAG TPA: PAS domain-containing sensor histidine kinase [Steroidobacter sp.]|uniref:sensor histidine kinase n=1 Tax=Steroidobacter sp. TaxID=1978227 RepID=UPI002ED7FC85
MAATPSRQTGDATLRAAICDQAPVMIWQAQPDGLLDYFNERVFEYSGNTYEQLVGSGWLRLLHPDDRQRVVHRWAYSLATRAPYEIEFRIRKRDKAYRWFLAQAVPTISADKRHLQWVGACTEVQRYVASLPGADRADSNATRMLHETTWAPWLHQRALEGVARKATAREASRAIAHLLNQPLTAILSNAQALQGMLNGATEPDELNHAVADIVTEVRRAIQVLRDWRVTLQGASLQLSNVRIDDLVRDAAALILGDLIANRCELELRLSPHSPEVSADAGQMQYALAMLIMNACEAMTDLPVEARRIRVRTFQDSVQHACIEVADHGPGVRSAVLRVFEAPPSMRLPGSGMGMSICKGIVEAHGGRLQLARGLAPEEAVLRVELPVAN